MPKTSTPEENVMKTLGWGLGVVFQSYGHMRNVCVYVLHISHARWTRINYPQVPP
jgi:hypothetical protein